MFLGKLVTFQNWSPPLVRPELDIEMFDHPLTEKSRVRPAGVGAAGVRAAGVIFKIQMLYLKIKVLYSK